MTLSLYVLQIAGPRALAAYGRSPRGRWLRQLQSDVRRRYSTNHFPLLATRARITQDMCASGKLEVIQAYAPPAPSADKVSPAHYHRALIWALLATQGIFALFHLKL
jgi:hypothetical protein